MCGVLALFLNRPLTETDIRSARTATQALAHRGPDDFGEWMDEEGGVYLGHRRLAIIDPHPRSRQPMSANGLVISFNGEIYNFRQLRQQLLERNVEGLRTDGDTEILVRALSTWGLSETLDRIDGMFAFVTWDGRSGSIAVDPFGEKPLFVLDFKSGIAVSSEITPLENFARLERDLDPGSTAMFMSLGCYRAPQTAYTNVTKVPAAGWATIEHGRIIAQGRYWKPPIPEARSTSVQPLATAELDELHEALVNSVGSRLISDVPVALFLSSGIDSSLVAAITSRDHKQAPTCFTVSAQGQPEDETQEAARIARALDLPHRSVLVERSDEETIDELVTLFGMPSSNTTAFEVRRIARALGGDYKVALTGIGGDEVTAGYSKYEHFYGREAWLTLPRLSRRIAGAVTSALPDSNRLSLAALQFATRDYEQYLSIKNFPALRWLRELPGFSAWASSMFSRTHKAPFLDVWDDELANGLADEHNLMYDHASMRESVELRAPFLSRELVEVVAKSDARAFVAFGQKSVLRSILNRYLPTDLTDQPKMGFRHPEANTNRELSGPVPKVEAIDRHRVASAWKHRKEHPGWARIALRVLALEAFERHASATSVLR